MKSVSQRYKASMRSPLRNRGYCVITLGNIDITAITDGAWSSPAEQYYSSFQTIDYDHAYGDPVADLGLNRWTLDGTFDIVDGQNDGFVYGSPSNASGVIPSVFSNVLLEKTFTQNHTLSGVTITWADVNFLVRVQYMDADWNKSLATPFPSSYHLPTISFAAVFPFSLALLYQLKAILSSILTPRPFS